VTRHDEIALFAVSKKVQLPAEEHKPKLLELQDLLGTAHFESLQ